MSAGACVGHKARLQLLGWRFTAKPKPVQGKTTKSWREQLKTQAVGQRASDHNRSHKTWLSNQNVQVAFMMYAIYTLTPLTPSTESQPPNPTP